MAISQEQMKENYANWKATQGPPRPAVPGTTRPIERQQVNPEARRAQLKEQMRGIDAQIQQARMAADRMRQDGLTYQAEGKDAIVKTLESQKNGLQKDLDQLAA
jgi:hypothetical protein